MRQRPKYLFIAASDRLARDIPDYWHILYVLRDLKVDLEVYGRGTVRINHFSDQMAALGESIGGAAENEARSKRMRDSWSRRRRDGNPTSNKVPYGLQLVGERDVPVPDSAPWVLEAFESYASGVGSHRIATRLAAGAPPHTWLTSKVGPDGEAIRKVRSGTRWETLRVLKLLKQSRYRGTIVPPEIFDEVQRRIANTPKLGSRRKAEYPLSGAMSCGGCGRHLHGSSNGKTRTKRLADGSLARYDMTPIRYYSCVVCNYRVNAERIEARFFEDVRRLQADEELLGRWIAAPKTKPSEITSAKREIHKLEESLDTSALHAKRDRLIDINLKGTIDDLELRRQLLRLEEEREASRARLATLRGTVSSTEGAERSAAQATELLGSFATLYEHAEYADKRHLLTMLVEALGGLRVDKDGLHWSREPVSATD